MMVAIVIVDGAVSLFVGAVSVVSRGVSVSVLSFIKVVVGIQSLSLLHLILMYVVGE